MSGRDGGSPGRIELRDEGVAAEIRATVFAAAKRALEGTARRARKVRRVGPARHVGIPRRVHGDSKAYVEAAVAQIGRINEGRACRIDLRDKGIGLAAAIRALDETARCNRKARLKRNGTRSVPSVHVGVPRRI